MCTGAEKLHFILFDILFNLFNSCDILFLRERNQARFELFSKIF